MAPCQLTVRPRPRLRQRVVSVVIAFDHVHDEQRRVCHSSFVSLSLSLSLSAFRPYRCVEVLNCNSSWVSWKAAALAHTLTCHTWDLDTDTDSDSAAWLTPTPASSSSRTPPPPLPSSPSLLPFLVQI